MKRERRPCWATVNEFALHADALPRVLAAMHLQAFLGTVDRGAIAWWQPAYLRPLCGTPAGGDVQADLYRAGYRARLAPLNRAMRDAAVILMRLDDRVICIDGRSGEWRSADGANRGRDLLELGVWRWSCTYGQAGYRLAKIAGLDAVPTYIPTTAAEVWAEAHARLRQEPAHG
jgi:hypothetical protein